MTKSEEIRSLVDTVWCLRKKAEEACDFEAFWFYDGYFEAYAGILSILHPPNEFWDIPDGNED